ncbi:MAG: pseudouridine synthase [Actinomycetota bacterium]|nr:pseudouridine synthase [Actinomycetota bacterium]
MSVTDEGVRLQKVLAQAGLGSRRACEELIASGRVVVDGQIVVALGTRVDPLTAVVRVDGQRVPTAPETVVLVFNKPKGVVSTMADDHGRECVGNYVADRPERLFHVGRLDADTEGLLIITNDGQLAQHLGHPAHEVAKTYVATVSGVVERIGLRALQVGVELDDGMAACDSARIMQSLPGRTLVELVIHQGRNRIVRRMFDAIGHPVLALVRTRVGPVALGQLRPGALRALKGNELHALYTQAGL